MVLSRTTTLFFCLTFLAEALAGAVTVNDPFPLSVITPPHSTSAGQNDFLVNEDKDPVVTYHFKSRSDPEEINGFYRRQSGVYKWKAVKEEQRLLIYTSADFRLNVSIQDFSGGGIYDIIVVKARGNCASGKCEEPAIGSFPGYPNALINGIPSFDGAKVIARVKNKNGSSEEITYYSESPAEELLGFYEGAMPDNGWKESRKIDFKDVDTSSAKFFFGENGIQGASILFSRGREKALVTVIQDPNGSGRVITIRKYEE